jgi:hypothetical protein
MKILNLYCSMTGNTGKIAATIEASARRQGHDVHTLQVVAKTDPGQINMLDYDFLFIGSGVYSWLPPEAMRKFIEAQHKIYAEQGLIKAASPRLPGKSAVAYATYGGPHTGTNEGCIVPKYLGQLPDHLGFEVVTEWLFPGEFNLPKYTVHSVGGRLGDIRGRPDEHDLKQVEQLVSGVLRFRQ